MRKTCTHKTTKSSSHSTLDSLFGIKGSVRLVPQGVSPKPHIILRRECLAKDGAELQSASGTARFSLVANKQLSKISKGQSLSVGIRVPHTKEDEELKLLNGEGVVTLEFDYDDESDDTAMEDEDDDGKEHQELRKQALESLPAKFRKSLIGTKTFNEFAEKRLPNSLGFPGYPCSIPEMRVFASVSVQTDASEPDVLFSGTPPPVPITNHKANFFPRLYPSPISTVDDHPRQETFLPASASGYVRETDDDAPTERSFSPMELSTPPQSPEISPKIISPSRLDAHTQMHERGLDKDCLNLPPPAFSEGGISSGLSAIVNNSVVETTLKKHVPSQHQIPKRPSMEGKGVLCLQDKTRFINRKAESEKGSATQRRTSGLTIIRDDPPQRSLLEKNLPQPKSNAESFHGSIVERPSEPTISASTLHSLSISATDSQFNSAVGEAPPIVPRAKPQRSKELSVIALCAPTPMQLCASSSITLPVLTTITPPKLSGSISGTGGIPISTPVPPSAPKGLVDKAHFSTVSIPIPQSTISNPLGIKPSCSQLSATVRQQQTKPMPKCPRGNSDTSKSTSATQAQSNLALTVGSKWTASRISTNPNAATFNNATSRPATSPAAISVAFIPSAPAVGLSKSLRRRASPTRDHKATILSSARKVGLDVQTAKCSKQVLPGIAGTVSSVPAMQVQALPKATQFSQDASKSATKRLGGMNGKEKNVTAVGNTPVSLKRTRGGEKDREVDSKVQGNAATILAIVDDGQQPRKKVKTEKDLELKPIPSMPSLSRFPSETSSIPSTLIRAAVTENHTPVAGDTRCKVDYGDLHGKSKSKRRRERKQKLTAHQDMIKWYDEKGEAEQEGKEKDRRERETTVKKAEEEEQGRVKNEAKEKEHEQATCSKDILKAASLSSLPQKEQPALRITHPLPPKPQVLMTSSSYRPTRNRERDRSYSRGRTHGGAGTHSRSRSRESRSRSRGRHQSRKRLSRKERDPSKGRQHDVVAEPMAQQVKDDRALETQTVKEVHPQTSIRLVSTNKTNFFTNARVECQLQGDKDTRVGAQKIAFASDGRRVGITCSDDTVRIWNVIPQSSESAKLVHSSSIVGMSWMEHDTGILTLCSDGSVFAWTPKDKEWHRDKLFHIHSSNSTDIPNGMAYTKDRIAVSTFTCVKVWLMIKGGIWQPQREIKRSGVTALRFKRDGSGLFGGCRDGTLWYSEVPNGTLRAYAFLPLPKSITSLDMHPNSTHLLVGQKGGTAYLIRHSENKGTIEKTYTVENAEDMDESSSALFATKGQAVVFGMTNGSVLVWDRKKGNVVYGLKHPPGDTVNAVTSFDGQPEVEGTMLSGTEQGKLLWWPIPQTAPCNPIQTNHESC